MAKLRIKAEKDLSELERFGFEKYKKEEPTWRSLWAKDKEKYIDEKYIEIGYIIDNGRNEITVVESRKNNDWNFANQPREIWVDECDYEMGVSMWAYGVVFDLIQADLVEKVEEGE